MKSWPVQNAKAHFSEMLNACVSEGPQVVTRHGTETAVLVSFTEWQRLNNTDNAARPSLKELLMSDAGRTDFDLPVRS